MPSNKAVKAEIVSPPPPSTDRPRVAFYGQAKVGDHTVECAVLADGRSGYIMRGLREAVGFRKNIPVPHFEAFLAEIAPNTLSDNTKQLPRVEVTRPGGGSAIWVEAGILTEIAAGVLAAAAEGNLSKKRIGLIKPCIAITKAFGRLGEVGLIHEATGYQHHRAPTALQDLLARLLRPEPLEWKRRFQHSYYASLCKLFGFPYGTDHRALPSVIGQITETYIYGCFPPELVEEIRSRRGCSHKLHQWLNEKDGLNLLRQRIDAVEAIARGCVDYPDFKARMSNAFPREGEQISLILPSRGKKAA